MLIVLTTVGKVEETKFLSCSKTILFHSERNTQDSATAVALEKYKGDT